MPEVVAYTDGGCRGNPGGVGAWAFVLIHRKTKTKLERAGGEVETTNNRMELSAAIEALRAIQRPSQVLIISDSKYVIHSATEWISKWKASGWRKKGGPLKNLDLLQELDRLCGPHQIEWSWVAGHSGEPGNDRVDELVNHAMDRISSGGSPHWEKRGRWKHRLPAAKRQG